LLFILEEGEKKGEDRILPPPCSLSKEERASMSFDDLIPDGSFFVLQKLRRTEISVKAAAAAVFFLVLSGAGFTLSPATQGLTRRSLILIQDQPGTRIAAAL
jgi:hypothetical protein